jgi:hypothetical protein
MLPQLLQKASLFFLLYRIDLDLAEQVQSKGCPFCGCTLHHANYTRKPRGGPVDIPDEYLIRQSLCCSNSECMRRTMPPSSLFMGRRVYWGGVILVVMTLCQGRLCGFSVAKLERMFSISRHTIKRWIVWFRDEFPKTAQWHRLRGRVASTVSNDGLPGSLVSHFLNYFTSSEQALVSCLAFLAKGLSGLIDIFDG